MSANKEKDEAAKLAGTLFAVLLIAPTTLFAGWVEWLFWGWFAVPAGLPALSYETVVGLGFLVNLLTKNINAVEKDGDSLSQIARALGYYAVALLMGWLWHFWVTP